MAGKQRHMEQRYKTFYARVTVPKDMRASFGGKQKLIRSLQTTKLSEANDKLHIVVAQLKAEINARRGLRSTHSYAFGSVPMQVGLQFRAKTELAINANDFDKAAAISVDALEEEEKLPHSPTIEFERRTMWLVATGAIAINEHLEAWIAEMRFKERTSADRRLAVRELLAWLAQKGLPGTVATIDNKVAGDFRLQALGGAGLHPRTANKRLEALRSYWRWLASLGYADENPWIGKSFSKRASIGEVPERPFTDAEIIRLFGGKLKWQMRDFMAIGALSGMRIDEIFQLRISDCADGVFNIRKGKTAASARKVPIHSALVSIVERRSKGKEAEDFLFEDGSDSGWDGNRSMASSKRFGNYRKSVGVHDVHEGNAKSKVNFHSFRRWFITKADQAGHREQDVARVVGHKVKGMSFGLYSGGSSHEQLRAVVESVKLPSEVVIDGFVEGVSTPNEPKLKRKTPQTAGRKPKRQYSVTTTGNG